MMFAIRFDFRNPPIGGTTMAERYAAALDMVEWADGLGCVNVTVSEHHGSDDGTQRSARRHGRHRLLPGQRRRRVADQPEQQCP